MNEPIRVDVQVVNALGMHARPAAEFVRLAGTFSAEITVAKAGVSVNGKSIMGVLMLAAERGSTLSITATGDDAAAAAEALSGLVADGFGDAGEEEEVR
ncbi:MAG: HPr family phosphocarrier protein [Longimicrobiales bacterium]